MTTYTGGTGITVDNTGNVILVDSTVLRTVTNQTINGVKTFNGTVDFTTATVIGNPGYTGSQGNVGFTGSAGFNGSVGFTGSAGFTGSQSIVPGPQGNIGYTGSAGPEGPTGFSGSQGVPGIQGFTGSRGATGPEGPAGPAGTGSDVKAFRTVRVVDSVGGTTNIIADQSEDFYTMESGANVSLTVVEDRIIIAAESPIGFTGSIGYTGSQGFTGSQGSRGYQGSQGLVGNQGARGYTGSIGFTGSQGVIGNIGYTGSRGLQGNAGQPSDVPGPQGFTGSTGLIGFTGSQGPAGPQGNIGFAGSIGGLGYTGSIGVQGFTGSEGNIGDTGFTGSEGPAGFTGSRGSGGYNGSRGYTGSVGIQGPMGLRGPIGYTGSRGNQGIVGPTGWVGSRGFVGSTGYTGSRGPVGPVGQGVRGYTGSQGVRGFTGSQGEPAEAFRTFRIENPDGTTSLIIADQPDDVMTFVAAKGITIDFNEATDTIIFAGTGEGGGGDKGNANVVPELTIVNNDPDKDSFIAYNSTTGVLEYTPYDLTNYVEQSELYSEIQAANDHANTIVAAEAQIRANADEDLLNLINTEVDRLETEMGNNTVIINDTIEDANVYLKGLIELEANIRANADSDLQDQIDALTNTAANILVDLDGNVTSLEQQIQQVNLDSILRDSELQTEIDGVSDGLAQEVLDRIAGDNALEQDLTANISFVNSRIDIVAQDLADETNARLVSDIITTVKINKNTSDISNVANALAQETLDRIAGDDHLQNQIYAQGANDSIVANNLEQEIQDRIEGDQQLQDNLDDAVNLINIELLELEHAIEDEANIRANADLALSALIGIEADRNDVQDGDIGDLEVRVDELENRVQLTIDYEANLTPVTATFTYGTDTSSRSATEYLSPVEPAAGRVAYVTLIEPGKFSQDYLPLGIHDVFTYTACPEGQDSNGDIIPACTYGRGLVLNVTVAETTTETGLSYRYIESINSIVDAGDNNYRLEDTVIIAPFEPQFGGQIQPIARIDGIVISPGIEGSVDAVSITYGGVYSPPPPLGEELIVQNANSTGTGLGIRATSIIEDQPGSGQYSITGVEITDAGSGYRVGDTVDLLPPNPQFGPSGPFARLEITSIIEPPPTKGPASDGFVSLSGQYANEQSTTFPARTKTIVGSGTGMELLITDTGPRPTDPGVPPGANGYEIREVEIVESGSGYQVGDVVEIVNNGMPEFSPTPPRARFEITEVGVNVGPVARGFITQPGVYTSQPALNQLASTQAISGAGSELEVVVRETQVRSDGTYGIIDVDISDGGGGYRPGDRVIIENNGGPEFSPLGPRAVFEVVEIGEVIPTGPAKNGVLDSNGDYSTEPNVGGLAYTTNVSGKGYGLRVRIKDYVALSPSSFTITDVEIFSGGQDYAVGDIVQIEHNGGPEFSPLGPRAYFRITEIDELGIITGVDIPEPKVGEFRPLTSSYTVTNIWEDVSILYMNTKDDTGTFHFLNAIEKGDDLVFQHATEDSVSRFVVQANVELNSSNTSANVEVRSIAYRGEIQPGDGDANTHTDDYSVQFFPAVASDVPSYGYVDSQDERRVLKSGDEMTGSLHMKGGDVIADGTFGSEIRAIEGADVVINDSGSLLVNGTGKVYTNEISSLGGADLSIEKAGSPSIVVQGNDTLFTNRVARYDETAALAVGNNDLDLVHKGYVDTAITQLDLDDTYVKLSGDTMFGELAWDDNIVNTIKIAPVEGSLAKINYFEGATTQTTLIDLHLKGDSDTNRYRILGGDSAANTMVTYTSSGDIIYSTPVSLSGHKITELGDPDVATDAANKKYVDGAITKSQEDIADEFVNVDGDTMTGKLTITGGGLRISNFNDLTVEGGDIKAINDGSVVTNHIKTPDNDPLTFGIQDKVRLALGTDRLTAMEPIVYDSITMSEPFQATQLIPKSYVDDAFIKRNDETEIDSTTTIRLDTGGTPAFRVRGHSGISFEIKTENNTTLFYSRGSDIRIANNQANNDNSVLNRSQNDARYGLKGDFLEKSGGTMTGKLTTQALEVTGNFDVSNTNNTINFTSDGYGKLQWKGTERLKVGNDRAIVKGMLRIEDGIHSETGLPVDGRINMNDRKIVNLLNPEDAQDAATKNYVDEKVAEGGGGSAEGAVLLTGNNLTETGWSIKNAANSKTFLSNTGNQIGIYNVKNPTEDHHAMPRSYADGRYLRTDTTNTFGLTTTFKPSSNYQFRIQNALNNSNNFFKVLSYSGSELFGVDGDGMTRVPRAPSADTHVANKKYVDDKVKDASGGGVEVSTNSSPPASMDRGTLLMTSTNNLYIYV